MKRIFILLLTAISLQARADDLVYPPTPTTDAVDDYFGTPVKDPYRWLENLDSRRTREWVDAQNALSLPLLAALPMRQRFADALHTLWNSDSSGVPTVRGGRHFYLLRSPGSNQPLLMVADGSGAKPRVLLDPNSLSSAGTVAISGWYPSPDGQWLAWGSAEAGSDWTRMRIRHVDSGTDLPEVIDRIKFSGASWTADSAGFFYARYPDPAGGGAVFDELSQQKLFYHRLRSAPANDRLIYARPSEPQLFLSAQTSDDGRFLFLVTQTSTDDSNQLYFADLGRPDAPQLDAPFIPLVESRDHAYLPVGTVGTQLLLLSNAGAPRRQILRVDLRKPELSQAEVIVAESAEPIQSALLAGGQLVVLRMKDASSRLQRYAVDGRPLAEIALPGLGAIDDLSGRSAAPELYFSFEAFNRPPTVMRVDLAAATPVAQIHAAPKLSFDPERYVTEQVFYRSKDGTRVPMFVSYRRGEVADGRHRVMLHGYGGFDIPKLPAFDRSALAWMEQGGVYAVANLRGGGEYGREWHQAGTKQRKQNVFDDFYAAGLHLQHSGWTAPGRIAIWGRSNGGLLVGASINQHPQFWGAAVATVGVLDMLRYHLFTVGYAWADDYGLSSTPDGFDYLIRYSPLHTVKPGTRYPATLITTGDHDDRVHPAHSYKYAAALQAAQAGSAPILIRVDRDAGHGSGKPLDKYVDEEADKLAFMWHYTGGDSTGD